MKRYHILFNRHKAIIMGLGVPLLTTFLGHTVEASPIWTMTTHFGEIDEVHLTPHKGVDYAMPQGTPLESIVDGKVIGVRHAGDKSWGNSVHIQDSHGREVIYGHLKDATVNVGDTVHAHDIIAHSGNTGHTTGPHLHLEIRINGKPINPMPDIVRSGIVKRNLLAGGL